jgi:hypothetical protein
MITDINFLLASAQGPITASAVASNVANLKNIYDVGAGRPIYAVVTVTTAFSGGTSVEFQVKASANETVDASDETIGSSGAIPVANLGLGRIIVIPLTENYVRGERVLVAATPDTLGKTITNGGRQYVGMWYAVSGSPSAGSVNVSIVLDPQSLPKHYDSGYKFIHYPDLVPPADA